MATISLLPFNSQKGEDISYKWNLHYWPGNISSANTNITTLEKVCSSFMLKCQSFMCSIIAGKTWLIAFTNDCLGFPFVLSKYSWVCFYGCLSLRKNSAYHCPFDMKQWTQCKIISVLGFLQCQAWILSSSLLLGLLKDFVLNYGARIVMTFKLGYLVFILYCKPENPLQFHYSTWLIIKWTICGNFLKWIYYLLLLKIVSLTVCNKQFNSYFFIARG